MVKIVNIENGSLKPTNEILLIEPFRTIWKRDKNTHKSRAINDFKYIEFMCSPLDSNPYRDLDFDKRGEKIIVEVFKTKFRADKYIKEAIVLYLKWLEEYSFSYRFLQSAKQGANEVLNFFMNVDLSERTKSGTAVYKPADITRALKDVNDTLKNIQSLEKSVYDEIKDSKTKGNKNISSLEK